MRRGLPHAVSAVPRHVWDPLRHNPKWVDSYAPHIAARRSWPAKRWLVGLDPRTPDDWLQFSYRNLAYAYNAALRRCSTFPEMVPYYQEMRCRGVKVDTDTMHVMTSRAARYDKMSCEDTFELFDDMVRLGARPDAAVVEVLHTIWEHRHGANAEWVEARRRMLVDLYVQQCDESLHRLRNKGVEVLLVSEMQRYAAGIATLGGRVPLRVWQAYLQTLSQFSVLVSELARYLWSWVAPSDRDSHPSVVLQGSSLSVPFLADTLPRPSLDGGAPPTSRGSVDDTRAAFAADAEGSAVLLTVVERCVDGGVFSRGDQEVTDGAVLSLVRTVLTHTGLLASAELIEQCMDIVKYSTLPNTQRDSAARALLNAARYGSIAPNPTPTQTGHAKMWVACMSPLSPKVVGRYIASFGGWGARRLSGRGDFSIVEAVDGTPVPHAADLRARIDDARSLAGEVPAVIAAERDGLPRDPEYHTGLLALLRSLLLGVRYPLPEEATMDNDAYYATPPANHAFPAIPVDMCEEGYSQLSDIRQGFELDVDRAARQGVAYDVEIEAWETMLMVAQALEDAAGLLAQNGQASDELFGNASSMRAALLAESKSRFGGRFRALYLQGA